MEFVEFIIEKYFNQNLYGICCKFWHLIERKHYFYRPHCILKMNTLEIYQTFIGYNESIKEKIIINDEVYFYNREDAEKFLEFVNSFYILNKLTE